MVFMRNRMALVQRPIMCRTPAASVKATRRIPAFPHEGRRRRAMELQPQSVADPPCGFPDRPGVGCAHNLESYLRGKRDAMSIVAVPSNVRPFTPETWALTTSHLNESLRLETGLTTGELIRARLLLE